jgi:hypothetical protein
MISSVNALLIVAGVVFVFYPLWYRRQMAKIRGRVAARGQSTERFDRAMGRPVIRVLPFVAPIAGVLLIIAGVTGG